MCLGVPGKVESITDVDGTRMAVVDFGGVRKDVCLAYVPEVEVGDYTVVHVGFAITRLDEESALETLRLFEQIGALEQEFSTEIPQPEQA
ncbi:MAG: HypC/HybG/HupF family hydrogenase formation chaperone [Jiangellales bacterium]